MNAATTLDLAALYRSHAGVVMRRIRRFYSAEQAPDILQEVFERALVKADTFRGDSKPTTWLYALTTHHCLARLRDHKRRQELLEEIGEVPWSRPIVESQTESKVFLRELWRSVDEELALIGTYYFVDGMSQADIGALLGVTGRTISNRIARLQELARQAAEPGPTGAQP